MLASRQTTFNLKSVLSTKFQYVFKQMSASHLRISSATNFHGKLSEKSKNPSPHATYPGHIRQRTARIFARLAARVRYHSPLIGRLWHCQADGRQLVCGRRRHNANAADQRSVADNVRSATFDARQNDAHQQQCRQYRSQCDQSD